MIRELRKSDINKVADIWLDTNIKAHYFIPSTTIYLWLISLTTSKELSILLLKLYNDGAIGISSSFLGLRVRN